jgi:hypothetical protein
MFIVLAAGEFRGPYISPTYTPSQGIPGRQGTTSGGRDSGHTELTRCGDVPSRVSVYYLYIEDRQTDAGHKSSVL